MMVNAVGQIAADEWLKTADSHDAVELDAKVVIPNRFHGMVVFTNTVRAIRESPLQQRQNMQ